MPPSDPPPTTSEGARPSSRVFAGIGFKIASTFAFTMMGATARFVIKASDGSTLFPVGQVIFFRSFFALIPVFIWLAVQRQLSTAFVTTNPIGHMRRGLLGCAGMFCGFVGIAHLPLPDAVAIGFASPLIGVVLAAFILGETVRLYRWSAVLIGFFGVIIMLWPHLSADALSLAGDDSRAKGALFALAGACLSAFTVLEVRKLTATERTATIVTYFSLMTTILGMLTMIAGAFDPSWAWATPTPRQAWLLVLVGILGGVGQIFLTESYRHAQTSIIAPFDYTSMIFALLIGYFAFGDIPHKLVLIGAAIVSIAGIYVIYREHQLGIDHAKQREASSSRTE